MKQLESLFDDLQTSITNETFIENAYSKIPEDGMVFYTSSRTGREAIMSAGRYKAITALLPGLRKRYIGPTKGPSVPLEIRNRHAVEEFINDNARCYDFNSAFNPWSLPEMEMTVLGEMRLLLSRYFEDTLPGTNEFITRLQGFVTSGPGASSDVSGDAGSYSRLANSSMSFSSDRVARSYKFLAATSPLSKYAEEIRHILFGVDDSFDSNAVFLSVPKTNDKNRGICTQPSGNMALQLATHTWLAEDILKGRFSCDLENQQFLNRDLAYYGSMQRVHGLKQSWSFCTIDLRSASNFPWAIVQWLFPLEVSRWLDEIRSPSMTLPDGRVIKKAMCSTMGNGFTFSLMTVLLSALVRCCYRYANVPEYDVLSRGISDAKSIKTWAVYGDDIIVDARLRFLVPRVLESLGFMINEKKTFFSGPFRESCGGDFYLGYDVRPISCESLDSVNDVYSLLNRLNEWSVYHSFPLPESLSLLRKRAREVSREYRIPRNEDVSMGVCVPVAWSYPLPSVKKNAVSALPVWTRDKSLCDGYVYAILAAKPIKKVIFRETTRRVAFYSVSTHEDISFPCVVDIKWDFHHANIPGVLLHMLSGEIRRGTYGVRPRPGSDRMEEQYRYSPGWTIEDTYEGTRFQQLSAARASAVNRFWEELTMRNLSHI